jgi:hypothetical protein
MIFKFQSHFFLVRLASLLGLSAILLFPMVALGYFTDEDNVADNGSFVLGAVDAAVAVDSAVQSLSDSSVTTFTLNTSDASTIATQSRLTFEPQSCRADFYNQILLEVTTASGTNAGTFADTIVLEAGVPNMYTLDVAASLDLVATANESCVILARLETWQTEFNEPGTGFSSVSQATITITTPDPIGAQETTSVVLNELYPAVLSTTTEPLERERVELYNGTGGSVDVAGWRIDEFVGGSSTAARRPHTIVSSCTSVSASDHMQPFGTTDTVIPVGGFLVVEFCGSASYLSDAGDTVQLYNAASAQVDAHAYPATTNGKSHARIPDGAAWVDPVPTPGNKNTATRADLEAEGWSEDLINDTLAKLVIDTSSSSKTVSTVSNTPVSVSAHSVGVSQLGTSTSSVAADISSNTAVRDATASSDGTQITSTSSETLSPGTASITQATTTIESAPTTASSSVTATQTPGGNGNTDTVSMSPATTTKPTVPDDMTAQTKSNLSDNPPVDIEEDERSGASKKTDAISAETNTSDNEQKPTVVDQTTDGEGDSKEKVTPVTESVNDQANETTN